MIEDLPNQALLICAGTPIGRFSIATAKGRQAEALAAERRNREADRLAQAMWQSIADGHSAASRMHARREAMAKLLASATQDKGAKQ